MKGKKSNRVWSMLSRILIWSTEYSTESCIEKHLTENNINTDNIHYCGTHIRTHTACATFYAYTLINWSLVSFRLLWHTNADPYTWESKRWREKKCIDVYWLSRCMWLSLCINYFNLLLFTLPLNDNFFFHFVFSAFTFILFEKRFRFGFFFFYFNNNNDNAQV